MMSKNKMQVLGMTLLVLMLTSSLATIRQASAAWPWEKPKEPEYPNWEPQDEWFKPPDVDPPVLDLTVKGLQDEKDRGAGQISPTDTFYDEDGNRVKFYQLDADKDGYSMRFNLLVKDGVAGADEEEWFASGVDKESVVWHIGKSTYKFSEARETKNSSNRAEYNNKGVRLKKGMKDVLVWAEARDNKGNSAKSDFVQFSVRSRSSEKEISREESNRITDAWKKVKIKAKNGEGPLRLDTTKQDRYGWLYYVAVFPDEGQSGGEPLSTYPDQETKQLVAYNVGWDYLGIGGDHPYDPDKAADYHNRYFLYWNGNGDFIGYMKGGDNPSGAISPFPAYKIAIGTNFDALYGGKYTGIDYRE